MAKIYATYRRKVLNDTNGRYTPSHFFDKMFADYRAAGLTQILDCEIMEEQYTGELLPGVPKLTRFLIAEYKEQYVTQEEFSQSLVMLGGEFNLWTQTPNDAKKWVRDNTNLIEETDGKFKLSDEVEVNGEIIPAKYLIID